DGVDGNAIRNARESLESQGVNVQVIAPHSGMLKTDSGEKIKIDSSFIATSSVLFDAVYIPAGKQSTDELKKNMEAIHFINESYKHCKAIAIEGSAKEVWEKTFPGSMMPDLPQGNDALKKGIFLDSKIEDFIEGVSKHRFWEREVAEMEK